MPATTGTIKYIKIDKPSGSGSNLCTFGLIPTGGNQAEELVLWAGGPTAPQWILNNATLLILREAYSNQTPVTVLTATNSALVTGIQLGAP